MRWEAWVLVISIVLGALVSIANTGKLRKPTEPGTVAIATVINGFFFWCVLRLAEVL